MDNHEISNEQSEPIQHTKSQLNTVTPLSKYLAMALFVILPFLGGLIGYTYAPEKIVEVEKNMKQSTEAPYGQSADSEDSWHYIQMCTGERYFGFLAIVTLKYPDYLSLDLEQLEEYCPGFDPGFHNYGLPVDESSDIIIAELTTDGRNIFYITSEELDDSTIITLHRIDLVTEAQTIVNTIQTSSAWSPQPYRSPSRYSLNFFHDLIPVADGKYFTHNWFIDPTSFDPAQDAEISGPLVNILRGRVLDQYNNVVYENTCNETFNGIRSTFDIIPTGTYFITACPDEGLYLGDWSTTTKIVFNTDLEILGAWPKFEEHGRNFSFINLAEGDERGLSYPKYTADIEGNIIKQDGSVYGGY